MKTAILIGLLITTLSSLAQPTEEADTIKVDQNVVNYGDKQRKAKGNYSIMHASFLFGNMYVPESGFPPQMNMGVTPSINLTHGYMFNDHWAAGAGVGFEIFSHNFFPLFAELRYTLWDNKIAPFVILRGGYSFCGFIARHYDELYLNREYSRIIDAKLRHYGGVLVHPEIGVKVPLAENSDLLFTLAYRYQKSKSVARVEHSTDFWEWEYNEKFNRLSFGIAIMFR